MKFENKDLFFRYACPCLAKLGEKGKNIIEKYIQKKEIPKDLDKLFPDAIKNLKKKYGDKLITIDEIKEYFLVDHNKELLEIYKKLKKLKKEADDVKKCLARKGRVIDKKNGVYEVKLEEISDEEEIIDSETILCKSLLNEINNNSEVVVHWGYIVDVVE